MNIEIIWDTLDRLNKTEIYRELSKNIKLKNFISKIRSGDINIS